MADKKYTDAQVREAVQSTNLNLTDDEVRKLIAGDTVELKQSTGKEAVRAAGNCSGIKIADLGGGCGLYLIPFPPQVRVCCEF